MKNFIYLSAFILLMASCNRDEVDFLYPQPEFVDAMTEIPADYHGTFQIDSVTHTVTLTTVDGKTIADDSVVVKKRGSFFYINTLNERGYYNLVVVKRVGFLNHEQITVYVPRFKISDDAKDLNQLKIFDFVGAPSLDYYNDSIDYVLENVTVNQLSILKNSSNKYNVERLK